jgi:hypothetical protein
MVHAREFRLRRPLPMRAVARALGAWQHRHNDRIRFIGNPSGNQEEIVGMPMSEDTFLVSCRFPALLA